MRQPGEPGFAGPLYTSHDQTPGSCYVLCPKRWRKGERHVLAVLEPLSTTSHASTRTSYKPPKQIGTRRIAVWPHGRPLEWRISVVPVFKPVPAWHVRARQLHAQGLSYRAIGLEVDKHMKAVQNLLKS
jgi:hypothetical protein